MASVSRNPYNSSTNPNKLLIEIEDSHFMGFYINLNEIQIQDLPCHLFFQCLRSTPRTLRLTFVWLAGIKVREWEGYHSLTHIWLSLRNGNTHSLVNGNSIIGWNSHSIQNTILELPFWMKEWEYNYLLIIWINNISYILIINYLIIYLLLLII